MISHRIGSYSINRNNYTKIRKITLCNSEWNGSLRVAPVHDRQLYLLLLMNIYIYHHHHVLPLAQISLTLPRLFSLSLIVSGKSSGLHPVSSHSCCSSWSSCFCSVICGVHRSTSLISSSLLLQQCPACLVRLAWIVFVMGGRWPYSWCLVGCCRQELFNIPRNILV